MVGLDREQARLEAQLAATIVEFLDLRGSEPVDAVAADKGKVLAGEFAVDEVAAALGWSTHRVQARARLVRTLRSGLPRTWGLWRSGDIDGYKASKVVEAADRLTRPESVKILDSEAAQRIVGQTATQLQRWLNRRVGRLEPDRAERRHRRAHADRRVATGMDLDGMGWLWMAAGAADIAAIDQHLSGLARGLGAEDPRTMDQRRADLAVDLLAGRHEGASTGGTGAAVGVVVPVQSLFGVDDTPGELSDRSASIPAALARQIAAQPDTLFYRLLTDELGNLLDVTQLGRFPSDLLGFAVDMRDGTCRWSTCSTAASNCDHDHTIPAPTGPTNAANLGSGCRRHHRAKTHAGFKLEQSEPGAFVWQTPTGHRYTAEPEPLPTGKWPTPVLHDQHTPITELIDLVDDTGPPPDHTTVHDALQPHAASDPLLAPEIELIASG
ncbi:MAG TPA: DUF222 domain-containing protein [Nocardioidaceae bacterium]|nr:DUF222 domain-containing protein [Nocardioidaceae bacterium]